MNPELNHLISNLVKIDSINPDLAPDSNGELRFMIVDGDHNPITDFRCVGRRDTLWILADRPIYTLSVESTFNIMG